MTYVYHSTDFSQLTVLTDAPVLGPCELGALMCIIALIPRNLLCSLMPPCSHKISRMCQIHGIPDGHCIWCPVFH